MKFVFHYSKICHHGMARAQVADGGDGPQIWTVAADIMNKRWRTADRGWSSSLGVGRKANNPHRKTSWFVTYHDQEPWTRMDSLAKRPMHQKMGIRFGTWNVTSLCRIGSLTTVARELGKCKLELVGVQEVRGEKGGTEWAEDYTFFYGQGNGDHQLGTGFFVHKRILSAVRRV
jgi:hypothetical protein